MTKALHTSGKKVGLHTIAGKKERSAKQAIWSPTLLWLLYDNRGLLCGNGKIATVGKIWWLHPIYMAHMCSFYSIKDNTDTSLVAVVREKDMKNVAEWINYASNYWPPLSKEARQKRFIIEEKEEKVYPESCSLYWRKKKSWICTINFRFLVCKFFKNAFFGFWGKSVCAHTLWVFNWQIHFSLYAFLTRMLFLVR